MHLYIVYRSCEISHKARCDLQVIAASLIELKTYLSLIKPSLHLCKRAVFPHVFQNTTLGFLLLLHQIRQVICLVST